MDQTSVILAPDKFKGTLSASEVASALAEGLRRELTGGWTIREHPLADGGEGTVEAIVEALDGTYRETTVEGPLGNPVDACWGLVEVDENPTAVIEMAAASGYDRIGSDEADPSRATTYGTGELIAEAVERGVQKIILGLGGSATVDGGLGMARALGFRFLDASGEAIRTPAGLSGVNEVVRDRINRRIHDVEVTVCSDVENPLLGENGAARVYGPQKGADTEMVDRLEEGLTRWADLLEDEFEVTARDRPGTGAAGGLGFGLVVLLDGTIVSGAETIMEVTGFNSAVQTAEVLITGEGRIDRQTGYGKTPLAAARRARREGSAAVIAVCGERSEGYEELMDEFDVILSILDRPVTLTEALEDSEDLLRKTGRDIGRMMTRL